jgi:hypothetical protein
VNDSVRATLGFATGRHYFEIKVSSLSATPFSGIGAANKALSLELGFPNDGTSCGYMASGDVSCSATSGPAWSVGGIVGVAVDLNGNAIYFAYNGAWVGGANPAADAGGFPLSITTAYPLANVSSGAVTNDAFKANFGASTFVHAPPAGYTAWCAAPGGG